MRGAGDDDPGLPIKLGPCANDEYVPAPLSPVAREAVRRARAECEENARRTGLTRRQFLLSVCAAATTLLALDACSREESRHRGGGEPGGGFRLPTESTTEPAAADTALAGEELIFDIQGHLLDYRTDPASRNRPFFGAGFPQADCGERDPRDCFSVGHFMEEVFLRSDTSMVVISAIPVLPEHSPLSIQVRDKVRQVAHSLCHDDRVLVHGEAHPNLGSLPASLDAMEEMARAYPLSAWKVYTHAPGPGWWLDDHDRGSPRVGEAFVRKTVELGIPRVCVHKGLGDEYASPADIGPAAKAHPDVSFIVYHSGYETWHKEGPYRTETAHLGVNRLLASMDRAGIPPNANVYAELGSTWWNLMRSPDQAAHVLGKLLRRVGEDNVVWGTDSIWYGSPQDQIQAFRSFEISEEYQERFGYPALTPQLKGKVLGLNALRVYGVKPVTGRCRFDRKELAELRLALPGGHRTYGPTTEAEARALAAHLPSLGPRPA